MNELTTTINKIATSQRNEVSGQIMILQRSITPQFYKNMSINEMKAEKMSIELLTSNIDIEVIAKMCELAVCNYGIKRSLNENVYFDINYILTFYIDAFNFIWCYNKNITQEHKLINVSYSDADKILIETWKLDKEIIVIKFISNERKKFDKEIIMSPKHIDYIINQINDVNKILD